ncbi:heme ABC transporter ATP-binding protein [Cytophagales bacterium LB-30]|uniref:Heme ABC transporter ATP-binding protein n=1 Tax=Shiella aurantiaca TaxID=3058365 RepID=A0ABT8F0M5_9BACT|nr:heme ABC transporter ATP-binding protein [Shiella aurantiaca]MDN4163995.1 heme ABC transporter ATP-binding protein [Shiella aurantiaca]
MISLENLTYHIKGKHLLESVSLAFEKGKMHIILGPNGAGKSTLIRLISGELKPSAGTIRYNDMPLHGISVKEQALFRAVLSQNLEVSFPLRVHEVVLMGRYPHFVGSPRAIDHEICEKSIHLFDLDELKNRNYLTLSGGEKQRVQFARVFAQIWEPIDGKPRVLLLDEPLTFLDLYYQYHLMKTIKTFMASNPDLTVIGVVHDIIIAAKFADQVVLMHQSKTFAQGPTHAVLNPENIHTVFKIMVEDQFIVK